MSTSSSLTVTENVNSESGIAFTPEKDAAEVQQGVLNGREVVSAAPQKSLFKRAWGACGEVPQKLKKAVKVLKRDVNALTIAMGKPECPLSAKIVAGATVAYALSPIDLIPDCIPVLGYLDDLIIVPIGIATAIRLIPPQLMEECRREAVNMEKQKKTNWKAAAVIGVVWAVSIYFTINTVSKMFF